jgi:hypothetical protein
MQENVCICCGENINDFLHYTLISKEGDTISICDMCYQEISRIEFLPNKKHLEFIEENNIKYYNTEHWGKLDINWNDIKN